MDGARACTQFRKQDAKFIPAKINKIEKDENCDEAQHNATSREIPGLKRLACCSHRLMTLSRFYTNAEAEVGCRERNCSRAGAVDCLRGWAPICVELARSLNKRIRSQEAAAD
jgi:hypothetical protein